MSLGSREGFSLLLLTDELLILPHLASRGGGEGGEGGGEGREGGEGGVEGGEERRR